jgi:outer membrane protein OmpA-like peptidoglycan-associated protein
MLIAALAVALLASGCATKKYVQQEVQGVDQRVTDVEGQVEQAQTDIRRNEEELTRQREALAGASKTAREAYDRAVAAGELAEGKLLFEVAMTDDKVRFGFESSELSDEAKAFLDDFAEKLKAENKNVFIEVQGHTDSTGSEKYNYDLGLSRAEAVRRYLNLRGIPLHRISVISYGETEPVADNGTREGRAQNRRVVLVVLE